MGGGVRQSGGVATGMRGAGPAGTGTTRHPSPGPIQRPAASQQVPSVTSSVAPVNTHARSGRGNATQPPPPSTVQPQQVSQTNNQQTTSQQQQQNNPNNQRSSNNPTSAQQAKFRADALSTTQAFFGQDGKYLLFLLE